MVGMITSTQKIIKIGTSSGVSLPARDLKAAGLSAGDMVEITVKPVAKEVNKQEKLLQEYKAFKDVYGETLSNLADR